VPSSGRRFREEPVIANVANLRPWRADNDVGTSG
jgi:hypothetical protein